MRKNRILEKRLNAVEILNILKLIFRLQLKAIEIHESFFFIKT
jgi:hypothetical protein